MGSDGRTPNGGGQLTLVSGFRVLPNFTSWFPGFATQVLRFSAATPEPGTLALLAAGAGALVVLGIRRRRR